MYRTHTPHLIPHFQTAMRDDPHKTCLPLHVCIHALIPFAVII